MCSRTLQEWIKVQNILSRTGKESLLQRVGRFDIDKVDPGMAMGAKEILKDLTLQQVRVVSAGAATFYVWVSWHVGSLSESVLCDNCRVSFYVWVSWRVGPLGESVLCDNCRATFSFR